MIARSVAPVKSSSMLHVNMTDYSSPADTVTHVSHSYVLKANTLRVGEALDIRAFASCAANANGKSFYLRINGTIVLTSGPMGTPVNNSPVELNCLIVRKATGGVSFGSGFWNSSVNYHWKVDLALDFAQDQTIELVLRNTVASAGDVVSHGWTIEALR